MNKLIITKCIECSEWLPADSHGGGVFCAELDQKISDDIEAAIPDICPRLATQPPAEANGGKCTRWSDDTFYASSAGCPVHGVNRFGK